MAEKKYYWVKLKDIFFDDRRIKILRKQKDGYRYICIYLMMQLKALKTDGVLKYSGILQNFAEEIAADIGESKKIVKNAFEIFEKLELIEILENSYLFLSEVPEILEYGAEQASAERVRKHREKMKALQCNGEVTPEKQKSNTEIDIEPKLETEKELDKTGPAGSLSSSGSLPKTAAEVREYCVNMGYTKVNPEYFFEYCEERGWKTGDKPIENWKALVKIWNENERQPGVEQKQDAVEPEQNLEDWRARAAR